MFKVEKKYTLFYIINFRLSSNLFVFKIVKINDKRVSEELANMNVDSSSWLLIYEPFLYLPGRVYLHKVHIT